MNQRYPLLILMFAALVAPACDGYWQTVSTKGWTVLGNKQPTGTAESPRMSPVIRHEGDEQPLPRVEGLDFEWGVETDVELERRVKPWEPTLPKSKWFLTATKERRPLAGKEFTLRSMARAWLRPDERELIDGTKFDCPEPKNCLALLSVVRRPERRFDMKMRHPGKPGEPLLLLGIGSASCVSDRECQGNDQTCCALPGGKSCQHAVTCKDLLDNLANPPKAAAVEVAPSAEDLPSTTHDAK